MIALYLSFYLVLVAMAIWSPRGRRLNAVLLVVLAVLLALPAYRMEGIDRNIYRGAYDGMAIVAERSFFILRDLSIVAGLSERAFFMSYALIAICLVLLAIYLFNRRIWWCVLVYYSCWYVLHPMIQMRAACAVGCFMLAAVLWRKWISLVPLAGSLFWHSSAALGIGVFLIGRWQVRARWLVCAVVVSVTLCLLGIGLADIVSRIPLDVIQAGFAKYKKAMDAGIVFEYRALGRWKAFQLCLLLVSLLNREKIVRLMGSQLFLNIWAAGLCFGLLVADHPALSGRGTEFLCTIEILLMPSVAFAFVRRKGWVLLLLYAMASTALCVFRADLFMGMAL